MDKKIRKDVLRDSKATLLVDNLNWLVIDCVFTMLMQNGSNIYLHVGF